ELTVPKPIDDRCQRMPCPLADKKCIAVFTFVSQGAARCPELQPRLRRGGEIGAQPAMAHQVRTARCHRSQLQVFYQAIERTETDPQAAGCGITVGERLLEVGNARP